jgi:hypothetical protein
MLGTSRVQVSGFRVTGAGFDAILVGASSHVLVSGNYLWGNGDVGVDPAGRGAAVSCHHRGRRPLALALARRSAAARGVTGAAVGARG